MADLTIQKDTQIVQLDTDRLIADLKAVEAAMTDEKSMYQKTLDYMRENYEKDHTLNKSEQLAQQSQLMAQLAISHTAKATDTALQMQQVASQLALSRAEIEFNKARTALVQAQTETEKAKKAEVERQILSYDDNLRVKEAENLANVVFGYASGGASVPSALQSTMLSAVDAITPNKTGTEQAEKTALNYLQTLEGVFTQNITAIVDNMSAKFERQSEEIATLGETLAEQTEILRQIAASLNTTPDTTQGN